MRRFLLPVVLLLAALVLQLTVLDRLPLPGGVAPDLVLLVVVALALSSGPMTGHDLRLLRRRWPWISRRRPTT